MRSLPLALLALLSCAPALALAAGVSASPGPLQDLVEAAGRLASGRQGDLAALRRYADAALVTYVKQDAEAGPAPGPAPGFEGMTSAGRATPAATTPEQLLAETFVQMKHDVVLAQVPYEDTVLQGLTPFQWLLLAKELPSANTFAFHGTLQLLEGLFRRGAAARPVAALEAAMGELSFAELSSSVAAYRAARSAPGADEAIVAEVRASLAELARAAERDRTKGMRLAAQLLAVFADALDAAWREDGATAAANELYAAWVDVRLLALRLAGRLAGPAGGRPSGKESLEIERAVRETLIYGPRMLAGGLQRLPAGPPAAVARPSPTASGQGVPPPAADGADDLRRLQDLQRLLLQIHDLQRRALRAVAEHGEVSAELGAATTAPVWLFADRRLRLAELERQVRSCVYGTTAAWPDPESVEGQLFDPILRAEVALVLAGLPDGAAGAGVSAARSEVLRILEAIKGDHERVLVSFLRSLDRQRAAPGRGLAPLDPAVLRARLAQARSTLAAGRDAQGNTLTPAQTQALRDEVARLGASGASAAATGAATAAALRPTVHAP